MANKILLGGVLVIGVFSFFTQRVLAQSTLEYAILQEGVAAAATGASKGQKGKSSGLVGPGVAGGATEGVYSQMPGVMNRASKMMGQVGMPVNVPGSPVPGPSVSSVSSSVEQPACPSVESVDRVASKSVDGSGLAVSEPVQQDRVYLHSGAVISGRVMEQTDDLVKIEIAGVPVTFFREEILKVERSGS